MFCSRRPNSLVNNVHERALRVVSNDYNSFYYELLMTQKEHAIHQQNIDVLMKEIFKFGNSLSSPLIDDMFQFHKINFNLRHFRKFGNTKKNSK